jgi:hypothetical protein
MTNPEINPSLKIPPNFQAPGYAPIQQVLIAQGQADREAQDEKWAKQQLLAAWEKDRLARQEAWDKAASQEEREGGS